MFDARHDELRQQFDEENSIAVIFADANLVATQIEAMQKANTRGHSGAKWPRSTARKHT
jgi:hypothetical protein